MGKILNDKDLEGVSATSNLKVSVKFLKTTMLLITRKTARNRLNRQMQENIK